MNRGKARSILFSALLLVSALTIIHSNYGTVSIDVNALMPFTAVLPCLLTSTGVTTFQPSPLPDIELSQWSGPPGTPIGITGCGFDSTDVSCVITSSYASLIEQTSPPPTCTVDKTTGRLSGSLTIKDGLTPAAPGQYPIIVTGCTDPVANPQTCTAPVDHATAQFAVAFVSTTVSTSTSTTTTLLSTSYSTLTTTTNFFSTLTTTTISSIGRSTETDFFVTLITVTAAASTLLTTISQTLTTSITALSTTFTTETVVQTSPATTSALMLGPVQNFYPDSLAVVAVLLLSGWLVLRRIIT